MPHRPHLPGLATGLGLLLLAVASASNAGAQASALAPVRNLDPATKLEAAAVEVTISHGALRLVGLQVGGPTDPGKDLHLAAIEGIGSPCRGLRVDGRGETLSTVCPDETGRSRLVLSQQGAVLRFERELVPDARAALSDDGVRVAVVTVEDGAEILRVIDLQQTIELGISGLDSPRHPVLAGGGSAVACTATVDGRRHVVLIDLVEERAWMLSSGQKESEVAAIAANGRRVLFRGLGRPGDLLYLADVDRQTLHSVSDAEGAPLAADLSQHGDRVAFIHRIGGAVGLFSADVNARKVVNLAGFFAPVHDVETSADGARLAYTTPEGVVTVVDTEGRRMETVAELAEGCVNPAMSSDGLWVAALCDAEGVEAAVIRLFPLPVSE